MGLSSADRVLVARAQSVAARFANGQQTRVHEQFGDQEPVGDAAAVAALHEVTTDPRLLTAAAAVYTDTRGAHWYAPEALRLLVLAGADEAAARRWREQHPPREFRFPQTG